MILKEFMESYRNKIARRQPNFRPAPAAAVRGAAPTQIETLLYDAGVELERVRCVLTERSLAVRDAAIKLGGKLLKDSLDEIVLNTCGELQVAPACDHAVMEFMSQRDHVLTLIKAVEHERNCKV